MQNELGQVEDSQVALQDLNLNDYPQQACLLVREPGWSCHQDNSQPRMHSGPNPH